MEGIETLGFGRDVGCCTGGGCHGVVLELEGENSDGRCCGRYVEVEYVSRGTCSLDCSCIFLMKTSEEVD